MSSPPGASGPDESMSTASIARLHATRKQIVATRAQTSDPSRLAADRVLCSSYEQVLCCPFASKAELELLQSAQFHPPLLAQSLPLEDKLLALRRLVISAGLPATEYFCLPADGAASLQRTTAAPSLRTCVWKVLLGALLVDASVYLALMKLGPCAADKKIRDDTFRTYKNNTDFWSVVSEDQLTRVLTATARVLTGHRASGSDSGSGRGSDSGSGSGGKAGEACSGSVGYVQGMNVLLAPFLYVMPTELDAFACFSALLAKHCPRYVLANLEGVHAGCALAEACLGALDPALHRHLSQRVQLQMEIFMFQFVLTLFANVSQLDQVLRVWDALFAFGVHFNCVLVATHIMLLRDELLQETSAFRVQRLILQTPLDAEVLVGCATQLLAFVPTPLRQALLLHPVEAPAKLSASIGFRAALQQRPRSKSSSSGLRGGDDKKASTDARISYLSTSKIATSSGGGPGVDRDQDSRRRPLSSSSTRAPLVQPRSPGCAISRSRILNPALRVEVRGGAPGKVVARPNSAPSSRSSNPHQRGLAPSPPQASSGRPEGWVRSLRVAPSANSASGDLAAPAPFSSLFVSSDARPSSSDARQLGSASARRSPGGVLGGSARPLVARSLSAGKASPRAIKSPRHSGSGRGGGGLAKSGGTLVDASSPKPVIWK